MPNISLMDFEIECIYVYLKVRGKNVVYILFGRLQMGSVVQSQMFVWHKPARTVHHHIELLKTQHQFTQKVFNVN